MSIKEQMHRLVETLPDASTTETIEALQYRLYVMEKIERGLQELDAGNGVDEQTARQELARWLTD